MFLKLLRGIDHQQLAALALFGLVFYFLGWVNGIFVGIGSKSTALFDEEISPRKTSKGFTPTIVDSTAGNTSLRESTTCETLDKPAEFTKVTTLD